MTDHYLDTAPCGFFSFTDDGSIHLVNNTICQLLGYTREELLQQHVEFIFTLPTRIFYQTHFFPLIKMQGHASEIFVSLLTKGKIVLPILLNAKRENYGGEYSNACAFIVVHNRKKFEDELVGARNAAQKALNENSELASAKAELQQRAEELDAHIVNLKNNNNKFKQFSRVVSHDLQEPLRKILLYSSKFANNLDSSEHIKVRDIERLQRASGQMRNIITNLQQFIWLNEEAPTFTNVDLNTVLQAAQEKVLAEYPNVFFSIDSEKLPKVRADGGQLELLFYHILSNAVKFRKGETSHINISCTRVQRNSFRELGNKYKYKDYFKIDIRDDGSGFSPEFKEDVFELFKRHQYSEDRGLGLALCKIIAESHDGLITADSELNRGTTITLVLPAG